MNVETLHDVLKWTQQVHHRLADCLRASADSHQDERARLLLGYLSEHEQELAKLLQEFDQTGDDKALHTFCYDFFQNKRLHTHEECDQAYDTMTADDIVQSVSELHEQVINLYQQLSDHIEPPTARLLIEQLLELERHETMRMVQGSNRLADI